MTKSSEMASQESSSQRIRGLLWEIRKVKLEDNAISALKSSDDLLYQIDTLSDIILPTYQRESQILQHVSSLCRTPSDLGGLGFSDDGNAEQSAAKDSDVLFLISAWLEALNSADRAAVGPAVIPVKPPGRRPMTLSEKIFAAHDIERRGEVKPGDLIVVDVDWIMASELSWHAMEKGYDELGKPGIFRNDRFWLAGDHIVDPRIYNVPQVKSLIDSSERAKKVFKMTENQGMNYTIMHTEFVRSRVQPGMLVIGSDSHTCSGGSVGCLAIGLGVADVNMPLITGQTWFRVPETVKINIVGEPSPGIGGKDVILYVLKELKRNTVASSRIVEYTGPGLKYLSIDSRFSIANMTTEFGGVTGIFVPDENTLEFIEQRKFARYKKDPLYFQPDPDAEYVEVHEIDLGEVEPFVARYPSPDDVVPISEVADMKLDGCFIGACTTTEEDLILAAMVLDEALKMGKKPVPGKRKVVPGSLPIRHHLESLGLIDVYERAGFEVGVPGCSYCVGMAADKASPGETWLSSQNRNFKNRMGTGSFGNVASAITVAASSLDMKISSPRKLLDRIGRERLQSVTKRVARENLVEPIYVEPAAHDTPTRSSVSAEVSEAGNSFAAISSSRSSSIIKGKVQTLGDFIDTDAIAPNDRIMEENIGDYCLEHFKPDFRQQVKDGLNIVVAGKAFGCGSSRDIAVTALKDCGVQCVIAKSFAFIYERNQPNLGLLGFVITDEQFYRLATSGADISIDLEKSTVTVGNQSFPFTLSQIERQLIECGGMSQAFQRFGKSVFQILCKPGSKLSAKSVSLVQEDAVSDMNW